MTKIEIEIPDPMIDAVMDAINDNPEVEDDVLVQSVLDQEPSFYNALADALREAVVPLMR